MKVLIIGSGGREHALAWKAAQSSKVTQVYVAPGNAGTQAEANIENVILDIGNHQSLITFAKDKAIDLTIVGPEAPLVNGLVDEFKEAGLACFGPSAAAAELEGSKAFTKDFLARHNIPTGAYGNFTDIDAACDYIRAQGAPIVVKADGLAAGKGVILAQTETEAMDAVRDMLAGNAFGEAGHRVVIEEFLQGEEASFICMVDGKTALPLASSQDHKAAHDGDTGPNTGGMGAYSPAPVVDEAMHQRIMDLVINPTVAGMAADGKPFTGFLYAGVMIDADGIPKVLEYNVRFGDPETQPIMVRMQSDLVELCLMAIDGKLESQSVDWNPQPSIGIVMAAEGYPGNYPKGAIIEGIAAAEATGCKVFHAGTTDNNGSVVTTGGRVLCVVASGDSVSAAQKNAYKGVKEIHWKGAWYRNDIGYRAIQREKII